MLITLTGSNAFSLRQELSRLTETFKTEYTDIALERLDGEEASLEKIQESVESLPFLASKKMVILYQPSLNKAFLEKAPDILNNLPDTTDVIIVEPKLDKRLSYFKFLKKQSDYKEFNELDEAGLAKWLVQAAKDQGGDLSQSDARYLVERVGASQQLLAHELIKLLNYDAKITRQTIDILTEPTPQSTIFELLDAALAGKRDRALKLYAEQRALKVEPQQIIAMLAWQLHILVLVKAAGSKDSAAIAKEAKLNPYVVRKSQGLVKNMSFDDVKKLVQKTLTLDMRLKSESIDADEALKNLLLDT